MKRFRRTLLIWLSGLLGGCIGGGISALGSKFGLDGLHSLGVDVPQLSLKQMGWVFVGGVITHAVTYIMKSPIPTLEFDDTAFIYPNPITGQPSKTDEKPNP